MIPSRRVIVSLLSAVALILAADVAALVRTDTEVPASLPGDTAASAGAPPVTAPSTAPPGSPEPPASPNTTLAGGGRPESPESPAASSTTPTTAPTTATSLVFKKDLKLDLSVSPACVTRGETLTITIGSMPDAVIALNAVDAASEEIGSTTSRAGPDGVATVSFTVRATAASGTGVVLAAGYHMSGHSGENRTHFQITDVAC